MKKIFTVLSAVSFAVASAQWNSDINENLLVTPQKASVSYTAKTNNGQTYVMYFEEGEGFNYKLRAQLLDKNGMKLFGEEGKILNTAASFSSFVQTSDIAVDEANNLYVTFVATGDGKGFMSKVSPEGVNVWGDEGVPLRSDDSAVSQVKILVLNTYVIVAYLQGGKGYLIKFDKNTGEKLWDSPVLISSPQAGYNYTNVGEMVKLSDDSFIVLEYVRNVPYATNGFGYLQRYNSDGETMWDTPTKISSTGNFLFNARYPSAAKDNSVYFGYSVSGINGAKNDAYIQKVNADGTLPWGDTGIDFSDGSYNEKDVSFVLNNQEIWAISTFSTGSGTEGNSGEYVQKLNAESGEVLLGAGAKAIYPVSASNQDVHEGKIQILDNQPVFMKKNSIAGGVIPVTLSLVKLDSEGTVEQTVPFSGSSQKSVFSLLVHPEDHQAVAVWSDARQSGTPGIYAQNLDSETLGVSAPHTDAALKVFPNPFTSVITLQSGAEILFSDIYDFSGKHIARKTGSVLQLSELNTGTYIIKTTLKSGKILSSKIIKR